MTVKKATRRKAAEGKPATRVPVSGQRDIMSVFNKDKNFHYRWVVDLDERGSRILKFERAGYHFSPIETEDQRLVVGEDAVYRSRKEDRDVSIIRLPTGGGHFSYLMRIKKEWYNEDQEAKQLPIDEMEAQITGDLTPDGQSKKDLGQYGSVSIKRGR